MNSMISYSRLAAAALCGVALVACNAVQDVTSSPTYPTPAQTVVVGGTVTGVGLSNTRPVLLEDDGQKRCTPPNSPTTYTGALVYCTYSVQGTTVLRFGALPVGAPYNIVVKANPFGRICTITNGSGVANAAVSNVTLNCVRDSTPLYTVTANIDPTIANALPAGFKLSLTTEEGTETVSPIAGQLQVVFANPIFNNAANPSSVSFPNFAWTVAATAEDPSGLTNNCAVTNPTNVAASGTTPPTGNVTATVTACKFTIAGSVAYSAPSGGAPQTVGALTVALKDLSGNTVDHVDLAAAAASFAFATPRVSNTQALYELVVSSQPAGQFCVVGNGGTASLVVIPAVVTATSTTPPSQPANISNLAVNCRSTPVTANQLTGTYQLQALPPVPPSTTVNPARRNFLTFFANGTFLYGTHDSATAAGVEHGFYNYNPSAGTIGFSVWTDTNGGNAAATYSSDFLTGFTAVSETAGLSGRSGYGLGFSFATFTYGLPGNLTATNVVKTSGTPGQLSMTFGAVSSANPNPTWTLIEPVATPGQMEGAWVTADSKQVWVYSKGTTSPGFHAGVNGAANVQDACFEIQDPTVASGFYTLRQGVDPFFLTPICTPPGGLAAIDIPNATSTPAIVPGFNGRMPGSKLDFSVSPSPVYFTVASGSPETLTIQNTLNDTSIGAPLVFTRTTAN